MWPIDRPPHWVGRTAELDVLRQATAALRDGAGSVLWIEGEPGIGKSSLAAEGLAGGDPRWETGWGMAEQLTQRLPLRVMLDCLQVRAGSPDPRRAHAAGLLRQRQLNLLAGGDASVAGVEILLTLADELCAAAPTVLVLDDLQWADDASLLVWHQLAAAASQLPLLLVGTCRLAPGRAPVEQLRTSLARRGATVLFLGPLPAADMDLLVNALAAELPTEARRQLTAQAEGNPLYARELADALSRDQAVPQLSASLNRVLAGRLSSVRPETARMLQTAALLGSRFAVSDLAVVLRQPVSALAAGLQEAVAAGIVAGADADLAFRHPLIRQALQESLPLSLRTALHAEAARELAGSGMDVLCVAQQLSAAARPGTGWAPEWLAQAAPVLAARAPQLAVELLQRELGELAVGGPTWDSLMTSLVWAQLAAGLGTQAARQAGQALAVMADTGRRAEMSWMLAHAEVSTGRGDDALVTLRRVLGRAEVPGEWRARMLALLSLLERAADGLDQADVTARQALTIADDVGDPFAAGQALTDLWLTSAIRRDHPAALGHIDRALRGLGDGPGQDDLRAVALDCRVFTLQNLDQWEQAELALHDAHEFGRRTGRPDRTTWANAAVLRYWQGRWDDALAELDPDAPEVPAFAYSFLHERFAAPHLHGVTALIAGRRDQRTLAGQHLERGLALPVDNLTDRENRDFLLAAHALALEQRGAAGQAVATLAGLLPRHRDEMTLTHQWMPDLVRLALAAQDPGTARTATQACAAEAAAETYPARAAAASLRCRGLLDGDPDALREAVAHYRKTGPAAELPAALEDLAVVLAARGELAEARAALDEAVRGYEVMRARWDIRRAESRLRPHGIRRGPRVQRRTRPASGWDALTPTEVRVAALLARGDSTSDIAQGMFLSRRTVQTYISRILAKLDAKSRAEIVGAAVRRGISA